MRLGQKKRRSLDQLFHNIIVICIIIVELKWMTSLGNISVDGFVIIEHRASIARGLLPSRNINDDYHLNKALFMSKSSDGNTDINDETVHALHTSNDKKTIDVMISWSKTIAVAILVFIAPLVSNIDMASADDEAAVTVKSSIERKTKQKESTLDEIWQLADKYYLDRNFNDQNWNDVKDKYVAELGSSKDEGLAMKLASEMVSTLGDKYSRVLDKNQYSDIQKYDLIGVGATLMPDENKDIKVGAPPVQGSAAYKAGIQYGDIITAVDGKKTAGRSSFDIIDQINDDPNRKSLTFSVYRPETKLAFDITLPRTFQQVRNPISYSGEKK